MATEAPESARPAWQTDDLEEEWVEEDEASFGTQSISLTAPLPGFLRTPTTDRDESVQSPSSPVAGGTFLIRDDLPAALLPTTPGRVKDGIKDFFSPLPLEKMFDPPSPPPPKPATLAFSSTPAIPSRLSQAFTPDDTQSEAEPAAQGKAAGNVDNLKPTPPPDLLTPPSSKLGSEYPFTFSAPRHSPMFPQGQSTPGPCKIMANPPATDPRLRLFQLQYDTFTRDHLSAMVDSIAVNAPSGGNSEGNGSPSSLVHCALSRNQQTPTSDDTPIRSIKRVKLSPLTEIYGEGDGEGATIARPRGSRVDYVGESRSLMQQIKQARDFSTISTTATNQSPASQLLQKSRSANSVPTQSGRSLPQKLIKTNLHCPDDAAAGYLLVPPTNVDNELRSSGSSPTMTVHSGHSSLAIRQQAEAFMQQIKNDMKGSKRLFSGDTDVSPHSHVEDGAASVADKSHHSLWSVVTHDKGHRNRKKSPIAGSPRRPTASTRHQQSPRKYSRSVSAEQDRSFIHEISNMSIEAPWQTDTSSLVVSDRVHNNVPDIKVTASTFVATAVDLPPPARSYLTASVRSNDDLNRFVSTSTASGTMVTASSAPSFIKHAGPIHITHIAPSDVPSLPQRIGRMVYDKEKMRWTRASSHAVSDVDDPRDQTAGTDGESEDPFRDIDSLREDDSGSTRHNREGATTVNLESDGEEDDEYDSAKPVDISRIEEVEEDEVNDQEEVDLTSFTFDGPSIAVSRVVPSEDEIGDESADSDSDIEDGGPADVEDPPAQPVFDFEDEPMHNSLPPPQRPFPTDPVIEATPVADTRKSSSLSTPKPPRSALKSTSATPASAMKDPSRDRFCTPAQRIGHQRSVSFSDGKRDGPIRGLSTKLHESDDDLGTSTVNTSTSSSLDPSLSARSKRLAEMMLKLEITGQSTFHNDIWQICSLITGDDSDSPTRFLMTDRPSDLQLQPLGNRRPSSQMAVVDSSGTSRRLFSMSQRSSLTDHNATFLTECSFGLAHDKLVQVITDVQPFEPHWEELSSIDLSGKALESVARLKEFMPRLDSLTL